MAEGGEPQKQNLPSNGFDSALGVSMSSSDQRYDTNNSALVLLFAVFWLSSHMSIIMDFIKDNTMQKCMHCVVTTTVLCC